MAHLLGGTRDTWGCASLGVINLQEGISETVYLLGRKKNGIPKQLGRFALYPFTNSQEMLPAIVAKEEKSIVLYQFDEPRLFSKKVSVQTLRLIRGTAALAFLILVSWDGYRVYKGGSLHYNWKSLAARVALPLIVGRDFVEELFFSD
jgi:hypothetical protein